jgi:hypothetical protein
MMVLRRKHSHRQQLVEPVGQPEIFTTLHAGAPRDRPRANGQRFSVRCVPQPHM